MLGQIPIYERLSYHSNRLRYVLKHYSQNQLIKDFLPAEISRFKEMCGYILEQNETANVEQAEARALTQVYLELEKSGENKLSQFQKQAVISSDFAELDHKLKLLVGLNQLDSGARSVNNNWRLLTQPGLVRRPVTKGIFWREPRRACENILEKCRVAYYRRFTMPHILELAAAQERFNVAVTRQVDQLTYLVGQLIQSETHISGSETPLQFEKALESLRQSIYLVGNTDSIL